MRSRDNIHNNTIFRTIAVLLCKGSPIMSFTFFYLSMFCFFYSIFNWRILSCTRKTEWLHHNYTIIYHTCYSTTKKVISNFSKAVIRGMKLFPPHMVSCMLRLGLLATPTVCSAYTSQLSMGVGFVFLLLRIWDFGLSGLVWFKSCFMSCILVWCPQFVPVCSAALPVSYTRSQVANYHHLPRFSLAAPV